VVSECGQSTRGGLLGGDMNCGGRENRGSERAEGFAAEGPEHFGLGLIL